MHQRVYQTDFVPMAVTLLPTPLRKSKMVAVLSVLAMVFNLLRDTLNAYRQETFIQLKYNAQVCRLEYCLNHIFNGDQPGITVTDSQAELAEPFYLYRRDPRPDSILMPVRHNDSENLHIMLNLRAHNAEERVDFTVYVPSNISLGEEELARFRSVVNNAKTPGKKWKLIHNA